MNPQTDDTTRWLLQGDAAIRWQVYRDLLRARQGEVSRERQRVAVEGWGASLLALQDRQGTWARGLYTPKWTSTTYTMLLLRDFGLSSDHAGVQKACALLLDKGFQADRGIGYKPGRSETCITGMVFSILCCFGHDDERVDGIAGHLIEQQMPDGGWNCRRSRGATHSSVHTTISVLEGLRLYGQRRRPRARAIRNAEARGREFLLAHRLYRSHRTGAVIKPEFTRLSFPPRWHYDILRALDHFQAAGAERDSRLAEAVEIVRSKQGADGRWPLEYSYHGKSFFVLERPGQPSRWNTLRALRVLRWWEG